MKDQIIQTSLQQFLKHGIRKMTVQKLVEPMGISTKTVYRYFSDKEDLLKHCLLLHYAELSKELELVKKESKNPLVAMFRIWHKAIETDFGVNHIFYHDLNYYYPQLQDAVLNKIFRKNVSVLGSVVVEGMKEGYFRDDLVPEITFEVVGILYASITRTGNFKKFRISSDQIIQNTIDTYLRGICTAKGLKELQKSYSLIIK